MSVVPTCIVLMMKDRNLALIILAVYRTQYVLNYNLDYNQISIEIKYII